MALALMFVLGLAVGFVANGICVAVADLLEIHREGKR